MTIKGIFFDAAGVFYRRPESTYTYLASLVEERGLRTALSPKDQARALLLRAEANNGRLGPDEYWGELLAMHGVTSAEERRALVDKINDYSDQVLAIPGGREALAGLKGRGFVLGIVTDTIYPLEYKMRWLADVGVAEFIDVMACSTELGTHKPDPAMYLHALKQARLAPGEAAFVGHDAVELEGARQVGMATVAVNYDPDASADYHAESLVGLLDLPIFQTGRGLG